MTPEAAERFEAWIASLPQWDPPVKGGPAPEHVSWETYTRPNSGNQGGCGNCPLFATVSILEVQYAVDCCVGGATDPGLPPGVSCCPAPDANGRSWIGLSVQFVHECAPDGLLSCLGGNNYAGFLRGVGTIPEVLESFELADEFADGPSPGICAMLDRRLPLWDPVRGRNRTAWERIADRNGRCDVEDLAEGLRTADADGDGLPDRLDNCVLVPNADQVDSDSDGVGDACEGVDSDGDGVGDADDNCPAVWNRDQGDEDFDGIGDRCEFEPTGRAVEARFHRVPAGFVGVAAADLLDALQAGPVAADVRWSFADTDGDGIEECTSPGADIDHVVGIIGFEQYGAVLLVRNSHGDPAVHRIWNGACHLGVAGMFRVNGRVESSVGCPGGWLSGDADGDTILNMQDACLYVPNGASIAAGRYDDEFGFRFSSWTHRVVDADPTTPGMIDPVPGGDDWPDGPTGCDNCEGFVDWDRWDSDGDGCANRCDGCPGVAWTPGVLGSSSCYYWDGGSPADGSLPGGRDRDLDELWNGCDNCVEVRNRKQKDEDRDGRGDACDRCPRTPTREGLVPLPSGWWGTEVEPGRVWPGWLFDHDNDTVGDICDLCPLDNPVTSGRGGGDPSFDSTENADRPREADTDGDGIGDGCDNCPTVPNVDQANCNVADEDGTVRPFRGDACDPYPCVDLCQEPYGRATFVETSVCDRSTGLELCSTGDRVQLDFCAVGFPSGLDPRSTAARDGFSLPTQVEGCACAEDEDCRLLCPDGGAGGGRWDGILLGGRRVVRPPIDYQPLYGRGALDDDSFSREGARYGRTGYREYYAGCDVAGWCSTVTGERRVQQPWDWVPDLDGRFPVGERDESRIAYFWAKPFPDGGFAGYPTQSGNTYVARRQRKNEPTLRLFPIPQVGRLRPTFRIREPLGPPPWWGGSAMLAGADLLSPNCVDCDDYRFDSPGSRAAGLVIWEWDATNRQYTSLARTKVRQGVFDVGDPAVAIAAGEDGRASEYWTFGGIRSGGAFSDEMWHASIDPQAGVGPAEPVRTLWLAPVARQGSEPWPMARAGAVLAVRGRVLGIPFMVDEPASLGDGVGTTPGGVDRSAQPALVLVGGRGPNGPLGDVWFYDGSWSRVADLPEVDGGLVGAAAVTAEGKLWLFGGETRSGPTAELWQVDLETGKATRAAQGGPWPAARRSAALAFDEVRRRLVVFGGFDEQGGLATDVWAFSLSAGGWTALTPTCAGNGCPAVTGNELAVVDPTRGELTVVTDPAGPDGAAGSWSLAQGIWRTGKELVASPDQEDCNGDGVNDLPWGARCGSGSGGFPDYGRLFCGPSAGALACRLPAKPAAEVASLTVPRLRAVAAADGRVAVLAERRLDILRVGPAGALATERSVALARPAHDVVLWRGQALVGDDAGLVAIRLSDGATVGRVSTCGKARRVFLDGNRALVLGLRSLLVASLDESVGQVRLQDLRIYPGPGGDLVVAPGSGCSVWYALVDLVCEVTGACTWSHRLPSVFHDRRLTFNQLLWTYELDFTWAVPALPTVAEEVRTGLLRDINYESPYLYANGVAGATAVYDERSEAGWEYAGRHDVPLWVRGSAATAGYRFLVDGEVLRMAEEQ